jgi:hypothetical protein
MPRQMDAVESLVCLLLVTDKKGNCTVSLSLSISLTLVSSLRDEKPSVCFCAVKVFLKNV